MVVLGISNNYSDIGAILCAVWNILLGMRY